MILIYFTYWKYEILKYPIENLWSLINKYCIYIDDIKV